MLSSLCRRNGVEVAQGPSNNGRTITLALNGRPPPVVSELAGIHRIQRIPANDKRGRRHTSTATIALLAVEDQSGVRIRPEDVRIKTKRGSGAGGQHRNKTDSAVELLHYPSGIVVQINSGRSQHQNIDRAHRVLGERLATLDRERRSESRNDRRVAQIATSERPSKDWTWNTQRGQVLCHETGECYDLARLRKGRA